MSKANNAKRRQMVVGNWKVNGNVSDNLQLLTAIKAGFSTISKTELVVCPSLPYLLQATQALAGTNVKVGAQTVSQFGSGAYTGEVSAEMLADCGCQFVIIGHNERRRLLAESNEQVATKFQRVIEAGITPIVCIGESLEQREKGNYLDHLRMQLSAVVDVVGLDLLERAVLAYEPVWAVGTGVTASPSQAEEVHKFMRSELNAVGQKVSILYGGSVKASNAEELFKLPDIDGALLGGASLNASEFLAICEISNQINFG